LNLDHADMTPLSLPPAIRSREQLDAVVENIVLLQREQAELVRTQESEIAAIREKYRLPFAELDRYLQMETSWVEAWARQNPVALTEKRSMDCPHAAIGFRETLPRVERASRKWTWTAAALRLAEVAWGKPYLRVPEPEVDREAILSDLAILSAEELREAGIKIVQGERFFIEPHRSVEGDASWQEAA